MNGVKKWEGKKEKKVSSKVKPIGNVRKIKVSEAKKWVAFASIVSLVLQVVMAGALFNSSVSLAPQVLANENSEAGNLCAAKINAVLIVDKSGSMSSGQAQSKCEWWNMERVGASYQWVLKTSYDVTKEWCDGKSMPPNRLSIFTPSTNSKIADTKLALSSFLNKLGTNDRSALVSFSNEASLDKQLSNNHLSTKDTVNGLITNGSTNTGDGIKSGNNELGSERVVEKANKVAILLTDGKPDKPSGNAESDRNYVLQKAQEAKDSGYKIYTIGLGNTSQINEPMLQDIATMTGAKYYGTEISGELTNIYNAIYSEISQKECEYGSISGCKYSDPDGDGILADEIAIPNREIILSGSKNETKYTDENGCYSFANLLEGTYTVDEGIGNGGNFRQTYPASKSYFVNLAEGENATGMNFGNYLPSCGNGIKDAGFISYADEQCDGTEGVTDHYSCNNQCILENVPYCGDGIKNGNETCDGDDGVGANQSCSNECNIVDLARCGDGIVNQANEQCDDGNFANGDGCSKTCKNEVVSPTPTPTDEPIPTPSESPSPTPSDEPTPTPTATSADEPTPTPTETPSLTPSESPSPTPTATPTESPMPTPSVMPSELQTPTPSESPTTTPTEASSESPSPSATPTASVTPTPTATPTATPSESPTSTPSPTPTESPATVSIGGGSVSTYTSVLSIPSDSLKARNVSEDSITITWLTSHFATSRVIYSLEGESHTLDLSDNKDTLPKYGYARTTEEFDLSPKVTGHSVTISGLTPGSKYYYRTVSIGSFAVSQEYSFSLAASTSSTTAKKGETVSSNTVPEVIDDKGQVKAAELVESVPENCNYLSEYISLGRKNSSSEVEKLEKFLNDFERENLAIDGIFDKTDSEAASRFQTKYADDVLSLWGATEATGNVFISTKNKINSIYCKKEIPLTEEQEAEIEKIIARLRDQIIPTAEAKEIPQETPIATVEPLNELGEVKGVVTIEEQNKEEDISPFGSSSVDENIDETENSVVDSDAKPESNEVKNEENKNNSFLEYDDLGTLAIIIVIIIGAYYFLRKKGEKEGE